MLQNKIALFFDSTKARFRLWNQCVSKMRKVSVKMNAGIIFNKLSGISIPELLLYKAVQLSFDWLKQFTLWCVNT